MLLVECFKASKSVGVACRPKSIQDKWSSVDSDRPRKPFKPKFTRSSRNEYALMVSDDTQKANGRRRKVARHLA